MIARDIEQFSQTRTKARAYFCYLFSKNLPNNLPKIDLDDVVGHMKKIRGDVKDCEALYILDDKGMQVTDTFTDDGKLEDIGAIRSSRAYYYRAVKEKRCTITDPYPSLITQELTVTISKPIFDDKDELIYIACIDVPLTFILKTFHPMPLHSFIGRSIRGLYATFAVALAFISLFLFIKSFTIFFGSNILVINIDDVFHSTILLTLSLAIFDLVRTLLVEEVFAEEEASSAFDSHKTMVRFLGSIIIALSIESLMLVFKFAMNDPSKIIYAVQILGGVGMLLIGLAIYIKFTKKDVVK
ncbi:MAG: hypothetical protein GQ570_08915 [Helicobacteraceae bacterium]|nr:hypothetical protein [Helicobacteraceae bacterium]